MVILLLVLNTLWFAAAFWFFSFKSIKAANLLLAKQDRQEPSFSILSHSIKFLGGMNFAMSILSIICLIDAQNFIKTQNGFLLLVFSIAHGSQFAVNIPIAIKEWNNEPHLWSVLKGLMLSIFITDALLFLLNLFFALQTFFNLY